MITHIDTYSQEKLDEKATLELNIIRNLSRDSEIKTAYNLHTNLSKDYSDVTKAVHRLHDKGFISSWCETCTENVFSNNDWKEHEKSINHKSNKKKVKKSDRDKGRTKRFLKLTVDGLKVAITDPLKVSNNNGEWSKISNNEFLKYLISNHQELELINIYKLFGFFCKKIYNAKMQYVTSSWLDSLQDSIIDPFTPYGEFLKTFLYIISTNEKRLTKQQIQLKLQKSFANNNDFELTISSLYYNGIITKDEDRKYELTQLGLIDLLFYRYNDAKKLFQTTTHHYIFPHQVYKSNKPSAKKTKKIFEEIRIKYSYLLPRIFNGGNYEKSGISFYEIVILLLRLYKNLVNPTLDSEREKDDPYIEELNLLQGLNKSRNDCYHRKQKEFFSIDKKLQDEVSITFNKKNIVSTAWFILSVATLTKDELKEQLTDFFYDEKIFRDFHTAQFMGIENRITFDFYSMYKAYCFGWDAHKLKQSEIRKWHDEEIRTLLKFSKDYINEIESFVGKEYY